MQKFKVGDEFQFATDYNQVTCLCDFCGTLNGSSQLDMSIDRNGDLILIRSSGDNCGTAFAILAFDKKEDYDRITPEVDNWKALEPKVLAWLCPKENFSFAEQACTIKYEIIEPPGFLRLNHPDKLKEDFGVIAVDYLRLKTPIGEHGIHDVCGTFDFTFAFECLIRGRTDVTLEDVQRHHVAWQKSRGAACLKFVDNYSEVHKWWKQRRERLEAAKGVKHAKANRS